MSKQKVAVDTNVVIAGLLYAGAPNELLRLAEAQEIEPYIDTEILEEIVEVIRRKKFVKKEEIGIKDDVIFLKILSLFTLSESANIVQLDSSEKCRDADDDKFIRCALFNDCEWIISGDSDLLAMKKVRNVKIASPTEFLVWRNTRK